MTDNEKTIWTDMYRLYDKNSMPQPKGTRACEVYWEKFHDQLTEVVNGKHNNHPLALSLGVGVFEALESKWHAINRKRGLE